MASPTTVTLTGNSTTAQTSSPIPLNTHITPFNVGIGMNTDGSNTAAKVQVTFDNPTDLSSATWFDHTLLTGLTSDTTGHIAFPVTAVRLHVDDTGTDVWVMHVLQAGIR